MPCLFPLLPGLAVSDDGGCPCARHCSNRSSCINSLPRQPHREASARTKPTAHLQMQASLGPESITLHSQQQVWTYLRLGPLLSGSTPPPWKLFLETPNCQIQRPCCNLSKKIVRLLHILCTMAACLLPSLLGFLPSLFSSTCHMPGLVLEIQRCLRPKPCPPHTAQRKGTRSEIVSKKDGKCSPHNICGRTTSAFLAPCACLERWSAPHPCPGPRPSRRPPSLGRTSHSLLHASKHVMDIRAL